MKRRKVLKLLSLTSGSLPLSHLGLMNPNMGAEKKPDDKILIELEKLRGEPPAYAEVRVERGGPRLFLNGKEVYPLLALSTGLLKTASAFKEAGINLLAPLIGLRAAWLGPEKYDWTILDKYLARLLSLNPDAYFMLRLHLNTPVWWKDSHPTEIIKYGLPFEPEKYNIDLTAGEGGYPWGLGQDVYEVSWASKIWREDTGNLVRAYLEHIENSPLRSRIFGYQPTTGWTGEWGYFGPHYLPDYSSPMQDLCGAIPDAESRINTTYGLLRNPEKEKHVIDFYRCYHDIRAEVILYFARIIKQETDRRLLCGVFYTYLLENVIMQEIGHLAPEKILHSKDIDFIVSPYSYLHTNHPEQKRWTSDIYDDAGNWLGRARGVGGDGAYRVLFESLRRYNKLFIVEMDSSTYLESKPYTEGGSGHETIEGTRRILQRDLGKMFATGCGGWLFDFGTIRGGTGWYTSKPIIDEINRFVKLGKRRLTLDIGSVSQIAAVYDAKSFFVTQHWKTAAPYKGMGCYYIDYINHWFLACQMRTFSRIGAPVDFLYCFDLTKKDVEKYQLIFMPNVFYLTSEEVTSLRNILKDSNTTVVWYYAPGFVAMEKLDLNQMERLTGFNFKVIEQPGPMMIRSNIKEDAHKIEMEFGVKKQQYPRFSVIDNDRHTLGYWVDNDEVAFAMKEFDGWTSVYVGAAPLPVEILRWLAIKSNADIWCDKPDIINATIDAVMIVATEKGDRILRLPKPMVSIDGGQAAVEHFLSMDLGEVKIFTTES